MDKRPPTAGEYRDTAEEIRQMARRSQSEELSGELFQLAERYDRLASHADKREDRKFKPVI